MICALKVVLKECTINAKCQEYTQQIYGYLENGEPAVCCRGQVTCINGDQDKTDCLAGNLAESIDQRVAGKFLESLIQIKFYPLGIVHRQL